MLTETDDTLSLVAEWAREHTRISVRTIARRFCVPTAEAQGMLTALQGEGVLSDAAEGESYAVLLPIGNTSSPVYLPPPDAAILQAIREHPGITRAGLIEMLGQTSRVYVRVLERAGHVRSERLKASGRPVAYWPTHGRAIEAATEQHHRANVRPASRTALVPVDVPGSEYSCTDFQRATPLDELALLDALEVIIRRKLALLAGSGSV